MRLQTSLVIALVGFSLTIAAARPAAQQVDKRPVTFTAFAVSLGDVATPSGAGTIEMRIDRWSTDEQRKRLVTAFQEGGSDALMDALEDLPRAGYIRSPGSLGYHLHFAYQSPLAEGGRQIILLTDRYMSFWEAANRPRSVDYPFTLVELRLDKHDEGVGKVSIAAKVTAARGNLLTLEDFATQPVRLTQVKRRG
ncbi:MAG TPA: hypothetical protein VEK56_15635 [Vicinamibacterales bacterium]|nr:hypothetical protein [Vicinamibacterales bacterium]